MDDKYVCTLDAKSLEKSRKELNEDPDNSLGSVQTLREWLQQQPHLNCCLDTGFLLRFLRTAKFSQLKAREKIEKYLSYKTALPQWMSNVDTAAPGTIKFIESGYFLPLGFDKNKGHYHLMMRPGVLDVSEKYYNKSDMFKGFMGVFHHLMADENIQVNGFMYFMDFGGFELKHQTYWGIDDMKNSTKMWQAGLPGRFKGFHYYNTGSVFETIMAILKPIMTAKFRDRIVMHGSNMESVYKVVPMELLPEEYLPDDYTGPTAGTIQDITERTKAMITRPEVRAKILEETSDMYCADMSKKPNDVPQASFRKLNVD